MRDSGLPYALLRNGWYYENYTSRLPSFLAAARWRACALNGAEFAT